MKNLILLGAIVGCSFLAKAQTNVVSIHVLPLALGEVRLGFEHVIAENYSIAINAGYFVQHEIPRFLYTEETLANNGITIEGNNSMEGFDIVPEIKRYFGSGNAPLGFYVGVFAKYSQYEFHMMDIINYEFSDEEIADLDPEILEQLDGNNSLDINVQLDSELKQHGGGLQLGYQFGLGKHWNFDIYFLGLEVDRIALDAQVVSPNIPVDYSTWVTDVQEASDDWDRWPFVEELEFEAIDNGVKVTARGLTPWYRGGFKIGFAF